MSTDDIVAFITARLDERQKALEDLAKRRAAAAIPAIEMQQHAAIQIMAGYPRHGMAHFEYEAFQELLRGVEAKRRILDLHEPERLRYNSVSPPFGEPYCGLCRDGEELVRYPCGTMCALASEWSTHPEFRPDWSL